MPSPRTLRTQIRGPSQLHVQNPQGNIHQGHDDQNPRRRLKKLISNMVSEWSHQNNIEKRVWCVFLWTKKIYMGMYIYICIYIYMVGGFNHLEKYEFVNGFRMTSHIWNGKKACELFETTYQIYIYICTYIYIALLLFTITITSIYYYYWYIIVYENCISECIFLVLLTPSPVKSLIKKKKNRIEPLKIPRFPILWNTSWLKTVSQSYWLENNPQ